MKTSAFAVFVGVSLLAACGDDPPPTVTYPASGALSGEAGKGSWRFGVATAATQIEDMNVSTDWYVWTKPVAQGGLGKGLAFVGDATKGYSKVMEDLGLVKQLGVDSYRFSIEWARIEPVKDQIDEAAIAHYRAQLVAMKAMGIHPVITLHHFSNPVWVADPKALDCAGGPQATNLCGFGGPGGATIVTEMGQHATLMAQRFGDLVDTWGTVNEPINYLLAAYGLGQFPPGRITFNKLTTEFVAVIRDYVAMHAVMYKAIKTADTIDADGDGISAEIGMSMSVADWQPSRKNAPSTHPDDIAARDRLVYLFHYVFVDSITKGTFDGNLDGTADEDHPEWANTLDWLGLQYYFRAGVSADRPLFPAPANLTACVVGLDTGSCLPAPDPTYCVPKMGYEGYTDGIGPIVIDYAARYPGMPLVVTEAGISTEVGKRRAENIVRNLESLERARDAGVDLRGYYHWSLTDNFEWAEGFIPRFGLYRVDYGSYSRTASEGATVYGEIAAGRALTTKHRETYGGNGPMTPETGYDPENVLCAKEH
ncbi:MAG: glycoside hydrolase family 1 protein [Deltaproteobacteria bacterium]|nr:glycoside hydrolase family 1 protein [Deltaproteobacteria bacterium]